MGSVFAAGPAPAPGARLPVTALPSGPSTQAQAGTVAGRPVYAPQVVSGTFNPYQVATNPNGSVRATVTQTSNAGILQWGSFDIGANATVNIAQPSSSAVLLNKVSGGALNNQTLIEGMLNANGQVYIYNPNGIVFGKTSQINVNALTATTLKVDDSRFLAGVLTPNLTPIFSADTPAPGAILLEGDEGGQARVTADPGGRLMFVAPQITNNGALSVKDGQVVLAAGRSVFISAPTSAAMRGLIVQVGNNATDDIALNDTLGQISVGRGNATLVGLAVNQSGTINASTSVNLNGSVYLRAAAGATKSTIGSSADPQVGGKLVLGTGSAVRIVPDIDDATGIPDSTAFNRSAVELTGRHVVLESGARLVAPGGNVNITARVNPSAADRIANSSRIDIGSGSVIDVAGSVGAQLAMESNVVKVELRGTELADNLLLRGSALRGATAYVDVRKGTSIANVSGWLDQVAHTVGEKTAVGGSVTLISEGDIIQRAGSLIDVSGGQVRFADGYINTSRLSFGGRLFDIGSASASLLYDGIVNTSNGPRTFEAGYVQGYSAGTVSFSAPALALDGGLAGSVSVGPRQRDVSATTRPLGGELKIGNVDATIKDGRPDVIGAAEQFGYTGKIVFGTPASATALPAPGEAIAEGTVSSLPARLDLDIGRIAAQGFTRVSAVTTGDIAINSPVALGAGGSVTLGAVGSLELKADVAMPGGKLVAVAGQSLAVGPGVTLDVAGRWTNDSNLLSQSRDSAGNLVSDVVNTGGSLDLSAHRIDIAGGTSFDVSGGSQLGASGKVSSGAAGSIRLAARFDGDLATNSLRVDGSATFSGYGFGKGGSLSLTGPIVVVGGTANGPLDFAVDAGFFSRGGFNRFTLNANDALNVVPGSALRPLAQAWQLNRGYGLTPSGRMAAAAVPVLLDLTGPNGGRTPVSVTLTSADRAVFGTGANLSVDPQGSVTFSALRQVTIDGTISAPAGTISVLLTNPPPSRSDEDYLAERAVWFGNGTRLLARGSTDLVYVDGRGFASGSLLGGGSIIVGKSGSIGSVSPATGYIVALDGSVFDVGGATSGLLRFPANRGGVSESVYGTDGGRIEMRAREGLLFTGTLRGAAGAGARGGSLTLAVDRDDAPGGGSYPAQDRVFNLVTSAQASAIIPAGLLPNQPIVGREGQGWLGLDGFANSGFDFLNLKSQNAIVVAQGAQPFELKASSSLALDAPVVRTTGSGNVRLNSSVVQVGSADWRYQSAPAAIAGNARLQIVATSGAGTVDLVGNSALQGFGTVDISAAADVRLTGVELVKTDGSAVGQSAAPSSSLASDKLGTPYARGAFATAGDISITATQIYPSTLTDFSLNTTGAVTVSSNGTAAPAPLSAAGKLTINAGSIVQNGVVRAPFGAITLNATGMLDYGSGSTTSVAGDGVVPFGNVKNGRDWIYDFTNGWAVNFVATPSASGEYFQTILPEKAITSRGSVVRIANGATLDLTGGGSLYGFEFTPGPGGSKDVLARSTTGGNMFAVLPGFTGGVAPRDPIYAQDSNLQPGDRIYLSGGGGLAAGSYTLLPAHYALLPGAYAVSPASGTQGMTAGSGVENADGTRIIAGYRFNGATGGADSRWSGFTVLNTAQVRARSEFTDFDASRFFTPAAGGAAMPSLPSDGGHAIFDAGQTLALGGRVKLAGDGLAGTRGRVDISTAGDLNIVSDASSVGSGGVKVTTGELAALGADSLLLGGIRYISSDGTDRVVVNANKVSIGTTTGESTVLTGGDIIAAAKDTLEVRTGAVVRADTASERVPVDLVVASSANPSSTASGSEAEGALLRLTGQGASQVRRGALGTSISRGSLIISDGATVSASGGVVLDATKELRVGEALRAGSGAALSIGASSISLGNALPSDIGGVRLAGATIDQLNGLSSLSLSSYLAPLSFYSTDSDPLLLGSAGMQLRLSGPGIRAFGSGGATVVADALSLSGAGAAAGASPTTTGGTLLVNARDISFGDGVFDFSGYSNVSLNASREARGTGTNGQFSATSDLRISAGRISAAGGSDTKIGSSAASGALVLAAAPSAEAPSGAAPLGGRLRFFGSTVQSDTDIVARSGRVEMTAPQGVSVDGHTIDVSGVPLKLGESTAFVPAGSIVLNSAAGGVTISSGATLAMSSTGADAGLLSISATGAGTGRAVVLGTIDAKALPGSSSTAPQQGRFALDVDRIEDFGVLNQKLDAAGFTQSREFRVRNGDVTLGAGNSVLARQTSIAVDNGNLTISGLIDASGPKGGNIELYASQTLAGSGAGNIIVTGSAVLNAAATQASLGAAGSAGDGGRIVLGTASADGGEPASISGNASISIANGARLDVSGAGAGQGGSVLLRAPRVSNANVAVNVSDAGTLGAAIVGTSDAAIEGYKTYSASNVAATNVETLTSSGGTVTAITPSGVWYSEGAAFLSGANTTTMSSRLGNAVNLRSGIELRSTGDMLVSVNETATNPQDRGWNLNSWRFGNQPGYLTLRAAGNLEIRGSISDGFTKPASGSAATNKLGMPDWSLDATGASSWSYRFVGGGNLAAANPLAVSANVSSGDFRLSYARTSGSVTDQPVALLRTGTGRIEIAAGRDIALASVTSQGYLFGAQIYTAGRVSATPGFTAPNNNLSTRFGAATNRAQAAMFGADGGGIGIFAARNITGSPTLQQVNNWLFRQGRLASDGSGNFVSNTAWWSRYDYFNQGVASFAGGDVSVVAGNGTIRDFSASVATNAWSTGSNAAGAVLVEQGGGDLSVRAGGDIQGGTYYVQKGNITLRADGSLAEGGVGFTGGNWTGRQFLAPVLALGDASATVTAGANLSLGGIFNPTLSNQSTANLGRTNVLDNASIPAQYAAYSTYAPGNSVTLTAVGGNLTMVGNQTLLSLSSNTGTGATNEMPPSTASGLLRDSFLQLMPGSLSAVAPNGNVVLGNGFSLWPDANGQLELLAGKSVLAQKTLFSGWNQPMVMLDLSPASVPTALNPRKIAISGSSSTDFSLFSGASEGLAGHSGNKLHAGDGEPVQVVAAGGNVDFSAAGGRAMMVPKAAQVSATGDVRDFGFKVQNLAEEDVTRIVAGRDFVDTTITSASSTVSHVLSGPGRLEILAGRNIDLGNGQGVLTRGNLDNPYLADTGASVMMVAGSTSPDYPRLLRETFGMSGTDAELKSYAEARKSELNDRFFASLAKVTGATGEQALDLQAYDATISGLFPAGSFGAGSINVFGSQVKTERGGSIDMLVPGGSVYAGLTSVPQYLRSKSASQLGIFTVKGGEIRSLVKQDFLVNQARVFTLGGGDITLASQFGDIDAGKGAKTAAATPPPVLKIDASGNVEVDISSSIAGSGIATLKSSDSVAASNVYPIAPRGTFDAGDAGIRSSGSVSIVAATVLNANNISASGSVSGAKSADTGSLGGSTAPPPAAPQTRADNFTNASNPNPDGASTLTVELLGLGPASSGNDGASQPAPTVRQQGTGRTRDSSQE